MDLSKILPKREEKKENGKNSYNKEIK